MSEMAEKISDDVVGANAIASEQGSHGVKGFKNNERKMIGRADQVYNQKTRRYEYHQTRPQKSKNLFTKYVIVVRRIIDTQGHPTGTKVDVRGPRLQKALMEINKDVPGFAFSSNPPEVAPKILYHSLEALEKRLAQAEQASPVDKEMAFELRAGIQFVREDFADTFASLETLLPTNQVTFDVLWTLYPPNAIIWSGDSLGHTRAYKVRESKVVVDQRGIPLLVLTVAYVESDGENVGWVNNHELRIGWFDGAKHTWHLDYIPLDLGPDPDFIRDRLLKQGRKALGTHGQRLVEYEGAGQKIEDSSWCKFNVHGRIMLDPQTWKRVQPDLNGVPTLSETISLKSLTEDDDKIILLSSFVYGYSLGDKIWGRFSVSQTREAMWNDEAFEALVLDDDLKSFVHDLVSEHKIGDKESFDDVVRDKGRGLVGLLAGPPGVGKTLTAEAIAEVSRRPLYTISSGELGHEPTIIHAKLTQILELAENWNAVVLLDEADVFLAARGDYDLVRNAIVSVFLRELEYYQGIMILTTNMGPRIDQAFQSRIHFSIEYLDLDFRGRRRIWQSFIAKAATAAARNGSDGGEKESPYGGGTKKGLEVDIDMTEGGDGLDALAALKLNGREIKNTVSIAQKVAMKRGMPMTVGLIQTAMSSAGYKSGTSEQQ